MESKITIFFPQMKNFPLVDFEALARYVSRRLISEQLNKKIICPHCQSENLKKNGHVHNSQRYVCLDCKKSFNSNTNTMFARTKKSNYEWEMFVLKAFRFAHRGVAIPVGIEWSRSTAKIMYEKLMNYLESIKDEINENLMDIISTEHKNYNPLDKIIKRRFN